MMAELALRGGKFAPPLGASSARRTDLAYKLLTDVFFDRFIYYIDLSIPGEGLGTLIVSYIRRLGPFFFFLGGGGGRGQHFGFQYFWGCQKNEYFWVMKILWIFFGGHHKIGLV